MWRYLMAGAAGAMVLGGGWMIWQSGAELRAESVTPVPTASAGADPSDDSAPPPRASEKTREEKRFGRYDKDRDGSVTRAEYLAARRKAFAKLDRNGDGRLDFDEYAVKTAERFAKADGDRSGALDAPEFLTTRVVRKAGPRNCPPPARAETDEG